MKGVDVIEHMASPVHENADDPEGALFPLLSPSLLLSLITHLLTEIQS